MSKSITGVGAVLSAAHRDMDTGQLHGHSWEVTAWFRRGANAINRQQRLQEILAKIDHTELPHTLAWGEDIAAWVASEFNDKSCVSVDVSRPLERIYARWEA